VLDAATGEVISELLAFDLSWIVWHPTDENQLLLGTDQQISIVQPFTGEPLFTYPYRSPFKPDFSPDGRYLALENGSRSNGIVVDIVDTANYQRVTTVELGNSLVEGKSIQWLSNEQLALVMLRVPIEIWNPFTTEIVDIVSVGTDTWNPQGTQFLGRTAPTDNDGNSGIAVYDRETEAILAQLVYLPIVVDDQKEASG
jgi:hypothetical protein